MAEWSSGRVGDKAAPTLPILERRAEIEAALATHRVIVLCGETGSGKTTQLPQICLEMGLADRGIIGHTQPRRLAARAVAARIAQERGVRLGGLVGYKVRFHDETSRDTRIKVMTDGMLLAEFAADPTLAAYSTIIIDEAHERSLNIDFLLGCLRRLMQRREDLRLIVTSATIDPGRFSAYFDGAPVIEVSGRMFPVEIRYRETRGGDEGRIDYEAVADAASELAARPGGGDVLVFLPGEREIGMATAALARHQVAAEVLPLYSRLSDAQQDRIFRLSPGNPRRVVLATNIAETSLTVPGIRSVVDTGLARVSRYDPAHKVQRLPVEAVSKASADQRAGRCGRVAAGVCIRLFEEQEFAARPRFIEPEIRRSSLANVILQMLSLGLGRVEAFPFLEAPAPAAVADGYATLFELGAIDAAGPEGRLTEVGRQMARLPLDARVARVLLGGESEGVLPEAITLAAALTIQDPRERPAGKQDDADRAQVVFRDEGSDFLTLLKVWDQYTHAAEKLGSGALAAWCREHFLSSARMREWGDLIAQLTGTVKEMGLVQAPNAAQENSGSARVTTRADRIHRALLTGLISNVACREDGSSFDYRGIRGNVVQIFPGSVLFKKGPKWIMAGEVVQTTRLYARTVAKIEPAWMEDLAAHMFRHHVSDPHLDPASGVPMAWERVTMSGIVVVPRRETALGPLDAAGARRVFIREGLAMARWQTDADWMVYNRAMRATAGDAEAKLRRRGVAASVDALAEWFEARVPPGIVDGPTLEEWITKWPDTWDRVLLSESDVVTPAARAELADGAFPDTRAFDAAGDDGLPLIYALAPGKDEDGVTATVELGQLPRISEREAQWLVPGMLKHVVGALVKGLPKATRSRLEARGKVEAVADAMAAVLTFGEGPLAAALSEAAGVLYSVDIGPDEWRFNSLPPHLRLRFRVVDHSGKEVAAGRDLPELRQRLEGRIRKAAAATARATVERTGITSWDFGTLPETLIDPTTEGNVAEGDAGFAALVDQGHSVTLTRLPHQRRAAAHTLLGLRRLFMLQVRDEAAYYVEALPTWATMQRHYAALGSPEELQGHLITIAAGRLCVEGQPVPNTREEFEERLAARSGRLATTIRETGEALAPMLESRFLVAKRLSGGTPRIWAESIADIREHAAYLMPRNFLGLLWWERLRHYPRYVGALWERLLAMREDGSKANLEPLRVLLPYWKRWTQVVATVMSEERRLAEAAGGATEAAAVGSKARSALPQARRAAPTINTDAGEWAMQPGALAPAVERFRWAIEELRLTLLAPGLASGMTVAEVEKLAREL